MLTRECDIRSEGAEDGLESVPKRRDVARRESLLSHPANVEHGVLSQDNRDIYKELFRIFRYL